MTDSKPSASQLIAKAASHDVPTREESILPDAEQDLSEHKLKHEIDILKQQLQELKDNHFLRTAYTNKIYWLVCMWLFCVIAALVLTGFRESSGFILSDQVLIAFIVTTTFNVLGLFAIVAKWMFQQNNKQDTSSHKSKK